MDITKDWELIHEFFSNNEHYISHHHIESFNTFVNVKIPYMIKTLNPFTILKTNEAGQQKHVINIYVGGRDSSQTHLSPPCLDQEHEPGDRPMMCPNMARIRDQTYACTLFADIMIEYKTYSDDGSEEVEVFENTLKEVKLGIIPVMVRSEICALHGKTMAEITELGECPYDQGGYFIIDGKEKVLVSQERTATNKFFMRTMKDTSTVKNEFSHGGLIRL
jgi:DNA-directed RNA polymerase II subunit RPB2